MVPELISWNITESEKVITSPAPWWFGNLRRHSELEAVVFHDEHHFTSILLPAVQDDVHHRYHAHRETVPLWAYNIKFSIKNFSNLVFEIWNLKFYQTMPISCLFTSPPAITTLLLAVTSKRVAENTEWVASPRPLRRRGSWLRNQLEGSVRSLLPL